MNHRLLRILLHCIWNLAFDIFVHSAFVFYIHQCKFSRCQDKNIYLILPQTNKWNYWMFVLNSRWHTIQGATYLMGFVGPIECMSPCCLLVYCFNVDIDLQWLSAVRCIFSGTPVSSTNKTDRHDITEILLKVAFNTKTLTPNPKHCTNCEQNMLKFVFPIFWLERS